MVIFLIYIFFINKNIDPKYSFMSGLDYDIYLSYPLYEGKENSFLFFLNFLLVFLFILAMLFASLGFLEAMLRVLLHKCFWFLKYLNSQDPFDNNFILYAYDILYFTRTNNLSLSLIIFFIFLIYTFYSFTWRREYWVYAVNLCNYFGWRKRYKVYISLLHSLVEIDLIFLFLHFLVFKSYFLLFLFFYLYSNFKAIPHCKKNYYYHKLYLPFLYKTYQLNKYRFILFLWLLAHLIFHFIYL